MARRTLAARIADLLEVERTVAAPPVSIDAEDSGDDSGPAIGDTLADSHTPSPEVAALSGDLSLQVRRALRTLSPREQRILRLRYGFGRCVEHTLEEIGAELGLTRQRILQIANNAMKKIRESRFGYPLRTFVD
jgi:RNA polymerase primary sigma factor